MNQNGESAHTEGTAGRMAAGPEAAAPPAKPPAAAEVTGPAMAPAPPPGADASETQALPRTSRSRLVRRADDAAEKPADKDGAAFRTISEVADLLATPAHVLRFWETRFPQVKPMKRAGGRRYYRPSDLALLAAIRHLLHDQGLTIRGAQKQLRDDGPRGLIELGERLLENEAAKLADANLGPEDLIPEDLGPSDSGPADSGSADQPPQSQSAESQPGQGLAALSSDESSKDQPDSSSRESQESGLFDALPGLASAAEAEKSTRPQAAKPASKPAPRPASAAPRTGLLPHLDLPRPLVSLAHDLAHAAARQGLSDQARAALPPLLARLSALRDRLAAHSQP